MRSYTSKKADGKVAYEGMCCNSSLVGFKDHETENAKDERDEYRG